MDNNQPELASTLENNIRDAFTDSLRDYIRSNRRDTNNSRSTPGVRHINIQLTQLLRELVSANTTVMNNYTNTINEYNHNIGEISGLIRTLSNVPHNRPTSPINSARAPPRNSARAPPRNSARAPPRNSYLNQNNQPPELLFSFLTQPSDINFNHFQNIFNDVPIYPTNEQIENAIEIFDYSSDMVLSNIRCPISLADFNDGDNVCRIRYCGHCYIYESLLHWFRTSVACPMCRYDIRNYSNHDETNVETNNETYIETNNETNNETNVETNVETNTSSFTFTDASNYQSSYQDLTDISNNSTTNSFGNSFGNSIQSLLITALNEGLSEYNTSITSTNGELQVNLPINIEDYYDISNN